jgi:putative transposase
MIRPAYDTVAHQRNVGSRFTRGFSLALLLIGNLEVQELERLLQVFLHFSNAQPVKGSQNRRRARKVLARNHLKISRQRKDHAVKLARCVIQSNDLVVYENLRVGNMVKNHCLAKYINDAGGYQFRLFLDYFATVYGRVTVAVEPAYTSQDCSECGARVQKSLSTRTHVCQCGCELDRDHNAALNILNKGLNTLGHKEIYAWGELTSTLAGETLSAAS